MKIEGTLTTLSPMTITAPNAGDVYVTLSGRRTGSQGQGGFPASEVSKLPIPAQGEHAEITVPVINANTLRGLLRRAGAARVEAALIARGETVRLGTYHALRCGSPYGHPDKAGSSLSEIQAAHAVPMLGVFGGGPRMIAGALRVDTGLPIVTTLVDRGLLDQRRLEEALGHGRLTTWLWLRKADDAAAFVDQSLAPHVIKDYGQSIDAWQTLIGKAGVEVADEVTDEKEAPAPAEVGRFRGVQSLVAFETVVPGVPFAFRMDVDSEDPALCGFALLALEGFANDQRLGGYGRLGFGRFRLDVTAHGAGTRAAALVRGDEGYRVNRDDPVIAAQVEAAETWLASVSAADLDALMQPSQTSRDDVRKKLKSSPEAQAAFSQVFD